MGWLLGGFLVSGVCFACAPCRGSILFIKGAGFCAGVVGCFVLGWWCIPFLGL